MDKVKPERSPKKMPEVNPSPVQNSIIIDTPTIAKMKLTMVTFETLSSLVIIKNIRTKILLVYNKKAAIA